MGCTRGIARSLARMAQNSERLRSLDFSAEPAEVRSYLYEIDALGQAQTVMHRSVKERTAALELQVKEAVNEALDEQAWTLQEQYELRLAHELSEQWPGEAQGDREDFHPQATVLFADIRNDREWARALDPQQLAMMLKRYYEGGGDTVPAMLLPACQS